MNLSGISMLIKGLGCLVTVGVIMWWTRELTVTIAGIAFVYLLVLLLYDFPWGHRLLRSKPVSDVKPCGIRPRFNIRVILTLLWIALPLGMVMFLHALQFSVPKLILEFYHGEAALGYFGPIIYPIWLGSIVVIALGQAASPRLANYYVDDLASYCRLMKKLLTLSLGMGLLLIILTVAFGKFALKILYTAEYANYYPEFVILAVGGAMSFMTSFCGIGLTSARVFKTQPLLSSVSCLATAVLAFLLVPSRGLRGAAVTSTAGFFVMLACYSCTLLWIIHKHKKKLEMVEVRNM